MKPREIKKLTAILKAVSDPTRRAIFHLLIYTEKTESISTVSKEFKITRQGITKHLKMLESAGLVKLKRIGRVTYCNAFSEPLIAAQEWMENYNPIQKEKFTPPVLTEEEIAQVEELVSSTENLLTEIEEKEAQEEKPKVQLIQMSIDPNDPGKPVEPEPVKAEPIVKEVKEKPIEVTDNQLDIYGIRKEPKVNEDSQLEMF